MDLQVGVKIFLRNKEGKYLIVRRSEKYKNIQGIWDIVGGRINPGTSLMDNLKREVWEETQLTITSEPVLLHAQDIILGTDRHIVRLSYTGTTQGEPVLDTSENTEFRWLTLDELKQWDTMDSYVKEILEKGLLK